MEKYTKDNPGCYHSMLEYLSKITGKSLFKEIEYKETSEIKSYSHTLHFILNQKDLGCLRPIMIKGGFKMLQDHFKQTTLPFDTKFDRIYMKVYRNREEFDYRVIPAGNYKDSLGGGWYSKVQMYQIDDKYFAMMECTC